MTDEKIILTADEAISLLVDGDTVHNYANPGPGTFLGVDSDRAEAIDTIRKALQLEIGGPHCQRMRHGLIVWTSKTRPLFFQTDPEKIAAMEAAKAEERARCAGCVPDPLQVSA